MDKRWVLFGIVFLVLFSILLHNVQGRQISLCINEAPVIEIHDCDNKTLHPEAGYFSWENETIYCSFSVSDPDNDSLGFSTFIANASNLSEVLTDVNMPYSFDNTTVIINFNTYLELWGTRWFVFNFDDGKNCENSVVGQWLRIFVGGNRPPRFIQNLPNKNLTEGTSLIPFDLDNYFIDQDGDILTYTVHGNSFLQISILASNQVLITAPEDFCSFEKIYFVARDPFNLTAQSNTITITSLCLPEPAPIPQMSSGGGGGSVGRSTVVEQTGYHSQCVPDYFCSQWSKCLPIGKQTRECIDIRSCSERERRKVEVRDCVYIPTCYDGILNGFEEEIDCGGPDCPSCEKISCTDGLMNGFETGIDCGGPDCPVCPTCFDNIKNRDEEGIDCGGIYCNPCDRVVVSDILPRNDFFTKVLMGVMLAVVVLLTLMKFFYGYIDWFLTKFMFFFSKKKKRIIVQAALKEDILKKLAALEKLIGTTDLNNLSLDFSHLVRHFFKELFGLTFEFTYNELLETLKLSHVDELLKKVLLLFFKRSLAIEFSGYVLTKGELLALVEEFRELIMQTSVLSLKDVKEMRKDIHYRVVPENLPAIDKFYLEISNAHLSLKHGEFVDAVSGYKTALKEYDHLSPNKKPQVYPDMNRLYLEILLRNKRSLL